MIYHRSGFRDENGDNDDGGWPVKTTSTVRYSRSLPSPPPPPPPLGHPSSLHSAAASRPVFLHYVAGLTHVPLPRFPVSFSLYSPLHSGFHRPIERVRNEFAFSDLSVRAYVSCVVFRVVSYERATAWFSLLSYPVGVAGERGSSCGVAVRQVTTSSAAERTRTHEGTARKRRRTRRARGGGGSGGGGCAGGKGGGGGEGTRVAARKRPAATADGGF